MIATPRIVANKGDLPGWSPAVFKDNRRSGANVLKLSCLVLDDDSSGLSLEAVCAIWAPFGGVVHSTHSHTVERPKWRPVLRVSRDMTPDEHGVVWAWAAARAAAHGQKLDESTRDPGRFWYEPGHREGALYQWAGLEGAALDVDRILAEAPPTMPRGEPAAVAVASAPDSPEALRTAMREASVSVDPAARLRADTVRTGARAWPAFGIRHDAKLYLGGALWHSKWPRAAAVAFVQDLVTHPDLDDREADEASARRKAEEDVNDSYDKGDAGKPVTGRPRLATLLKADLVPGLFSLLDRMGERYAAAPPAALEPNHISTGRLVFRSGGWDEPLAPPVYVVDRLLVAGSVVLLVAHGGSLKSMVSVSMGAAVAMGRPWLEHFPTMQGPAVVVDYERGAYEARRRMKLLRVDDVRDFLHCTDPAAMPYDPTFWDELRTLNPRLVVIDSLAGGTFDLDVSENEKAAARPLALAHKFANETQAAVEFVHHVRKGGNGDKREAVRGSTAIFAAVDAVYQFEPLDAPDGIKRMRLDCIKMNLGREPASFAVEFSDERGLVWYEEPAAVAGRNSETSEGVQDAICLALEQGPVPGVRALAKMAGRTDRTIKTPLALLIESRQVWKSPEGYQLDDDDKRMSRLLAFVGAFGHESRFSSPACLARAVGGITTHDVERAMFRHLFERSGGGGYVRGANWPASSG